MGVHPHLLVVLVSSQGSVRFLDVRILIASAMADVLDRGSYYVCLFLVLVVMEHQTKHHLYLYQACIPSRCLDIYANIYTVPLYRR